MTRKQTRTNLPKATQVLRTLLSESDMTAAELARIVNLPTERIRTLTRGNAPMRIDEAERIASTFDRNATIFFEKSDIEPRRNQYVLDHRNEIKKFQEALEAEYDLHNSFQTFPDKQAYRAMLPKDLYYDGTIGRASAVVKKETLLIDTLFSDIEYLDGQDTILLAGSKETFLPVATIYMHRWWDQHLQPSEAMGRIDESGERERCSQYLELMAAFERAEAFPKDSFNPAQIELDHMIADSPLKIKPTTLKEAKFLYYQSMTSLKKYEYFRFVRSLMRQDSKKGTIFGDSTGERVDVLRKLGVINPQKKRTSIKVTGITPIQVGYSTITRAMSDTELARFVISEAQFYWFFSYDGQIVASDGLTVVASSIEEVADCMRRQGFFAGDEPNRSTGVFWEKIPRNEKEFLSKLDLDNIFED